MTPMSPFNESPFNELAARLEKAQDWSTLDHILQNVETAYQQDHILQTQAESLALTAAVLSRTLPNQSQPNQNQPNQNHMEDSDMEHPNKERPDMERLAA